MAICSNLCRVFDEVWVSKLFREGRSTNAEVDYVLALNGRVIPIEIKAGATGRLKSLHQFVGEKSIPLAVRFDSGLPSKQMINTSIRKGEKTRPFLYI